MKKHVSLLSVLALGASIGCEPASESYVEVRYLINREVSSAQEFKEYLELKETDDRSGINAKLDSFSPNEVGLDFANEDTPIYITPGYYYILSAYAQIEAIPKGGLDFQISVTQVLEEGSDETPFSTVLKHSHIEYDENFEPGEYSQELEVLVPKQLPVGKYLMMVSLIDEAFTKRLEDANKECSENGNCEDIPDYKDMPEIGGLYFMVEENEEVANVEVLSSSPSQDVELFFPAAASDGMIMLGSTTWEVASKNEGRHIIRINGQLKFDHLEVQGIPEEDRTFNLHFLQKSEDGEVSYVAPFEQNLLPGSTSGFENVDLTYFISEEDYPALEALINVGSEPTRVEIIWTMVDYAPIPTPEAEVGFTKLSPEDIVEGAAKTYRAILDKSIGSPDKVQLSVMSRNFLNLLDDLLGVQATSVSKVSATLFDFPVELLEADGEVVLTPMRVLKSNASVDSKEARNGYRFKLEILDTVIKQEDQITAATIDTALEEGQNLVEDYIERTLTIDETIDVPKWEEKKSLGQGVFFYGPAMFTYGAGVQGSMVVEPKYKIEGTELRATARVDTPLSVSGFAEGNVEMYLARASLTGTLTVIEQNLSAELVGTIDPNLNTRDIDIDVDLDVSNQLNAVQGSVVANGQVLNPTSLDSCEEENTGINYPCPAWFEKTYILLFQPWLIAENTPLLKREETYSISY